MTPSIELLEAVLNVKKVFGVELEENDMLYVWSTADEQEQYIDAHRFAHACKVWAFNNWWDIESGIIGDQGYAFLSNMKNEEQITIDNL